MLATLPYCVKCICSKLSAGGELIWTMHQHIGYGGAKQFDITATSERLFVCSLRRLAVRRIQLHSAPATFVEARCTKTMPSSYLNPGHMHHFSD